MFIRLCPIYVFRLVIIYIVKVVVRRRGGWGGRDDCQISTINSFGKKNEFFIESNEFISIETDFLAKMQHLYDPLGPKQNLIFWPKKLVSE